MSEEMKDVVERVTKYLTERAKLRQLDPDKIHGLHGGDEREAYLTVSDLRALLSERRKMVEALTLAESELVACSEYLDPLIDADGDSEGFHPNREMTLKADVDRAIEQIDGVLK